LAFISILFVFLPANTTHWGLYPIDFLEIMVGFEIVGITFVTVWYFGKFISSEILYFQIVMFRCSFGNGAQ